MFRFIQLEMFVLLFNQYFSYNFSTYKTDVLEYI